MEIIGFIFENFDPNTVFSLAFLLAVVGTGVWFSRQFWPWYAKIKSKEQDNNRRLTSEIVALRTELHLFLDDFAKLVEFVVKDMG